MMKAQTTEAIIVWPDNHVLLLPTDLTCLGPV
jgi:hypothetical protein